METILNKYHNLYRISIWDHNSVVDDTVHGWVM